MTLILIKELIMFINRQILYFMAVALLTAMSHSYALGSVQCNQDNLGIATQFFNAVVNDKDFEKASRYLGDWYIEHDPEGVDGPSGLNDYIEFLKRDLPLLHVVIKRTFVSEDYVIFHVHSKSTPDDRGQAIIDIFRLENGKVVEHWDVTQDIPELSKNDNGMF